MSNEPSDDPLGYGRAGTVRRRVRALRPALFALLTIVLLLIALLVTANCAREQANRVYCAGNLRQIGQGVMMYASKHGGKLPDDLASLLEAEDLSPNVFCCPNTSDVPAAGPTTRAVMDAMKSPGSVSYVYVGKGLGYPQLTDHVVLVYESLSNHRNAGMNVLFGDRHVEFLGRAEAQTILAQHAGGRIPIMYPAGAAHAPATLPTPG